MMGEVYFKVLYSIQNIHELFSIVCFTVLFLISFTVHRKIIPKGYFSLDEIAYMFDLKRFWTASNIRCFFIGAIIFLGYYQFDIKSKTVYYSALGLVSLIQVFPVIMKYQLYKFWEGTYRFKLFCANIFYVAVLFFMGFACLEFMIPAIQGEKGYIDTVYPSINFVLGIFLYIFPLFIQFSVQRNADFMNSVRINFLHTDTTIMLRNIDLMNRKNSLVIYYKAEIKKNAEFYKMNPELLKSVLLIEEFNRGSLIQSFIERLLINYFPEIVLKQDMSIGFGQVKISTASRLLNISEGKALEELANPIKNIEICARYIRLLINQYAKNQFRSSVYNDLYDYIAKNYIGAAKATMYNAVLYAAILRGRSKIEMEQRLQKEKDKKNKQVFVKA